MPDLALYVDGIVFGLSCRAKVIQAGNKIRLEGEVSPNGETSSLLWQELALPNEIQQALQKVTSLPEGSCLRFAVADSQTILSLQSTRISITAATGNQTMVLVSLQTKCLSQSNHPLFRAAYEAAQFLCLDALYFRYGKLRPNASYSSLTPALFAEQLPMAVTQSDVAFLGKMLFDTSSSAFAQGMQALLGIHEMIFAATKRGNTFSAGLYLDHLCAGKVTVDNLFFEVGSQRLAASGTLRIGQFGFVLGGFMKAGAFSLEGALAQDTVISLGHGWQITELALAIGYQRGIAISMLGRITARKLMLFAALRVSLLPDAADLQLLSAASSEITLPALVESVADAEIPGVESFDFVGIEGFSLPGAPSLTKEELSGGSTTLQQGLCRALTPAKLAPQGETKVSPFDGGWMITDTQRMRHYLVCSDGRVLLNPQFYYATTDQPPLAGYEIHAGTFFCGVLRLFGCKVKLFFQSDETGVMAYLNITPICTPVFSLTQSSFKQSRNVQMPAPGSLVTQYLDPDTNGPELFIRMAAAEQCFYLDARLQIWSIFNFDAHIVFADKQVSVDTHFDFLKLFEVDFYLRADYTSINALSFEFSLIANTDGLKKLVEKAEAKLEEAARKYDERMGDAINKVNEARNSLDGLWSQIHSLDAKIEACRERVRRTSKWKRWIVAIGAGFEIGAYEVAKAGVYVALGVAQAALNLAEGILQAAKAIGDVALKTVQEFLKGITSLFYIERLAFAGTVNAQQAQAALGVQLDFVALGKKHTVKGMLSLGDGADQRCGDLLNGMVENDTKADVEQLESGTRSAKQRYRAAALEGNLDRFAGTAEYCRQTTAYMQKLGEACAEQYGGVPCEADAVLLGVDSALRTASQNANLVLEVTDRMNFAPALRSLQTQIDAQPESRARTARRQNCENLQTQWDELRALKNRVRTQSRRTESATVKHIDELAYESAETAMRGKPAMTKQQLDSLNPDLILDRAETLMHDTFGNTRASGLYCPYCEPAVLQAMDERRIHPEQGQQEREALRARSRKSDYITRL